MNLFERKFGICLLMRNRSLFWISISLLRQAYILLRTALRLKV